MLDEPNSIDFLMEAHDGNLTMQKTQPCDLEKWTFPNHESGWQRGVGTDPRGDPPR